MNADIVNSLEETLLSHAKRIAPEKVHVLDAYPAGFLITYGDLSHLAKDTVIARAMGPYLTDLAERAKQPLDALVVRRDTGLPGRGFCRGAEFDRNAWELKAHSAIEHLLVLAKR